MKATRTAAQNATYDIAVIGAGVFGSWIAYHLQYAGMRVVLIDSFGAANSRASSGGESRVLRCAYGDDEIYTRFAYNSLSYWKDLSRRLEIPIFHAVGVLCLARKTDNHFSSSAETLRKVGVPHETLSHAELRKRFPQFFLDDVDSAIYEPQSGALMARRSVQMLVEEMSRSGVDLAPEPVVPPSVKSRMDFVKTTGGRTISAGAFVFACGSWLPKLFPNELGFRIFPTRQEIFFFGAPAATVDLHFRRCRAGSESTICTGFQIWRIADSKSQATIMARRSTRIRRNG